MLACALSGTVCSGACGAVVTGTRRCMSVAFFAVSWKDQCGQIMQEWCCETTD